MKKDIWFIGVNLNGLWSKKAMKGIWDKDLESWWDSTGNFNCWKVGLDIKKRVIVFASHDKKYVDSFIKGAKAMSTLNVNLNHLSFSK